MQKACTCKDCRDALLVAGKLSRRGPCPQRGWPARQAQVGRRSAAQHTWALGKLYENSQVVRPRTPSVANPGNHDRLGFNVRTVLLQGMSFDGRQTCQILLAHFSESSCSGPLRSQATLRSLVMLSLRPRQSTTTRWTYFAKVRRVLLAKKFSLRRAQNLFGLLSSLNVSGMKPQKVISLYEQEMLADPEFDTNLAPKVSF